MQSSNVSGVTTEDFNSQPVGGFSGAIAVGLLVDDSGPGGSISVASDVGGANGSNFYSAPIFDTGATILFLNSPQSYFGFWWSAADAGDVMHFLSGPTLLGSFSSATTLAALPAAYDGNPNNGNNTSEQYVCVNVFGTGGMTFDAIVFENTNTFTGLELDNLSIRADWDHRLRRDHPGRRPRTVIAGNALPCRSRLCGTSTEVLSHRTVAHHRL